MKVAEGVMSQHNLVSVFVLMEAKEGVISERDTVA